ncbi:MFS transporter [Streptomyces poriticola]|uniref:MFS transporter n=1 Tax=Streptomyces poriticola TaxID=3120506 RepID=UPI002FCDE517
MSGVEPSGPASGAGARADRRLLSAAVLVGAPAEVLYFLLPLWAGSGLHAGAAEVGALIAVEALLSLLVRSLAGQLCDRRDPRRVAAGGAALYAVSFAGYAVAGSLPMAFAAAALGGVGGALFWVALRTWIAAGLPGAAHTAAYGALLSAEGKGALVGYLVAFGLLDRGGYPALFWTGCAVCALAAVRLVTAPADVRAGTPSDGKPEGSVPVRRMTALTGVTALTSAAEAGLWMVLLRLQEELGMEPIGVAGVFAPGYLVLILLPEHTHRITDRIGRTATLVVSFAAGALFAGGLGVVSSPAAVSALWALTAACLAAQIPVEQATVAAVAEDRPGRGIGRYASARLAGAVMGTALLGQVYEGAGWAVACLVAAAAFGCGAAAVPYAIGALGLPPVTRSGADGLGAPQGPSGERPGGRQAAVGDRAGVPGTDVPDAPRWEAAAAGEDGPVGTRGPAGPQRPRPAAVDRAHRAPALVRPHCGLRGRPGGIEAARDAARREPRVGDLVLHRHAVVLVVYLLSAPGPHREVGRREVRAPARRPEPWVTQGRAASRSGRPRRRRDAAP